MLRDLLANPPPRVLALIARVRPWWPVFSFASGLASYLLVARTESRAPWLAALLAASWLYLFAEPWFAHWRGYRLSWKLARLVTQAVQQETFFFALPFLIAATEWTSAQALFTGLVAACALLSITDPLYDKRLRPRRALYLCFHAFALFLAALTVAPLLARLDTAAAYRTALAIAALGALPGLARLPHPGRRWLALPATGLFAATLWLIQPWVPPATLWLAEGVVSHTLDAARRAPGKPLERLDRAALARGLYAYTALHAPLGLKEPVFHVWRHEGRVIDRIRLEIAGGRDAGYRAWSHKLSFPREAAGRWRVTVETAGGQRIGALRFEVSE